ncbi:hypothetical protein J7U46_11760 [Pelomonas sp. V22]|uniref:hypothetical protein n=1 Tax=Pelomonas sp. V22 TaxID=2822139 RepID=UPI0024A8A947|nr:hypothetical protein [Pelomonas sp. V22]MDI4633725.1 hypothetical protein [Pelomonas sp. V22]
MAGLLLMLLAGVGLWPGVDHGAVPSVVAAKPAASASADEAEEPTHGPAWALASLATREADAADRRLILDAAELQRLDEADCKRMAPAMRQLEAGKLPEGPTYEWDPASQEHENWLRRWIHVLKQRGDERSLATADFLDALIGRDDLTRFGAAAQRLHQRASRSSDGFVQALAAQRSCAPSLGCTQAVPRERWAQLEPGNLSAWLAGAPSRQPVSDDWLNGLMQASYDNSYRGELMSLLRSLPPQLPAGPRRFSRDLGLIGINAAQSASSLRGLNQHCAGGSDGERCRALAEKLWTLREANLMNWMQNLTLVRHSPPMAAVWEARAQEAEAAFQWSQDESAGMLVEPLFQAYRCKESPVFERWVQTSLTVSESAAMLAEIKARGLDVSSLSAKYRQQNGRSLLQAARK